MQINKDLGNSRAFTLIELLVVISIISLLSSVVLASLNTAREKGRIAAARKFATHTYRSFGAEAAAVLDFEDFVPTRQTIIDKSGNNNNFENGINTSVDGDISDIVQSDSSTPNSNSNFSIQCSVGVQGKAARLPINDNPSIRDLTDDNGTITYATWFKSYSFAGTGPNTGILGRRSNTTTFSGISTNASGRITGVLRTSVGVRVEFVSNKSLNINQWHHVAMTIDGQKRVAILYLDGQQVSSYDLVGTQLLDFPSSPISGNNYYFICNNIGTANYINGAIDDVAIYTQSLTSAQIQRLYAQSASKYLAQDQKIETASTIHENID